MRSRKLGDRVEAIHGLVDKLDRSIERIEIVTVVREPNTALSADAYNGLRKQVIAAASERNAHVYQLAQFDAALRAGATSDELAALVREWMGQASMEVVEDLDVEGAFEFVGPEEAPDRRIVNPAYVDRVTGRVVRAGLAQRIDSTAATREESADRGKAPVDEAAPLPDERLTADEASPEDGTLSVSGGDK